MPKLPITLKKATDVATFAMTLQRQTYKFDAWMYDRGVYTEKTQNARQKYDQLTASIELLKSLVSPVHAAAAPGDTKSFSYTFLPLLCALTPSGALKSVVNFVPLWLIF